MSVVRIRKKTKAGVLKVPTTVCFPIRFHPSLCGVHHCCLTESALQSYRSPPLPPLSSKRMAALFLLSQTKYNSSVSTHCTTHTCVSALRFWLITHNYKNYLATSDYFGLSSPYNRKHCVLPTYFSATLFPCYKYILLKLNTSTSPILHTLFSLACMIPTMGNSSTDEWLHISTVLFLGCQLTLSI